MAFRTFFNEEFLPQGQQLFLVFACRGRLRLRSAIVPGANDVGCRGRPKKEKDADDDSFHIGGHLQRLMWIIVLGCSSACSRWRVASALLRSHCKERSSLLMGVRTAALRALNLALFVFRQCQDGFKRLLAIFTVKLIAGHSDLRGTSVKEGCVQRIRPCNGDVNAR